MKKDEAIVGVIIFLFGAITTFFSLKMPIGTFRMAGTGLFPLCLGILLMILSAAFISQKFIQHRKREATKETPSKEASGSTLQMGFFLAAMVFAALFFDLLGYPLTAFLLMVALLRSLGMKRWGFNLLLSLITAGVSYFLFVQWLKIPMPKGWLGL